MVLLLAAIVAAIVFGLDAVLNGISTFVTVALTIAVLGLVGSLVLALGWIVIRDAADEMRFSRGNGLAWRWQLLGYAGILGILADGIVGTWNVYQEHIQFSTAVEKIPFAGVPVLLALASYPFKWVEQFLMRKQ
jgi:MFS family permease